MAIPAFHAASASGSAPGHAQDGSQVWDIVVVGAGLMGSACAYFAAQRLGASATGGPRVLVLEQFHLLHRRGSSHGESRITRRTYPSVLYTTLMKQAFDLWARVEADAGVHVYERTGGIDVLPKDSGILHALLDACKTAPCDVFSAAQLRENYGLTFPDDRVGVYQRDTGILRASATVAMFQALARKYGAVFREHSEVVSCLDVATPTGTQALLACKDGSVHRARRVVLACGPWAEPVLKRLCELTLPLQVWQCTVIYFSAKRAGAASSTASRENEQRLRSLPVVIDYADSSVWTSTTLTESASDSSDTSIIPIYSCPHGDFPGLIKFAVHEGVRTTADERTYTPDIEKTVKPVQKWLSQHIPFLDTTPVMSETCLYTMTPEEDFIVDKHPSRPHIVIAAGFSGHGFKFGCVIGDACAELALTGVCSTYDLSAFKITRPTLNPAAGSARL